MAQFQSMTNIDGTITPTADARVPVLDRGFLYGDSIYEVFRTYDGVPLFYEEHWARLQNSAALIRLRIGLSLHELTEAIRATVHNYADYALSDEFESGLEQLMTTAAEQRTAIMCAEAVWWRCHRRIIADYLLLRGRSVIHLMGEGRNEPARITPAAREREGRLVYPAPDGERSS